MHKAHETIWLQVDPNGESCDPEQWSLEDDATWCKDQINANDVKYVRADIAEDKLAAEQAKNMQLREALESCGFADDSTDPEMCGPYYDAELVQSALSAPSDTSTLEAIVKKAGEVMREECITVAGPEDSYQDDWFKAKADACNRIRALPAVTLEDLK